MEGSFINTKCGNRGERLGFIRNYMLTVTKNKGSDAVSIQFKHIIDHNQPLSQESGSNSEKPSEIFEEYSISRPKGFDSEFPQVVGQNYAHDEPYGILEIPSEITKWLGNQLSIAGESYIEKHYASLCVKNCKIENKL